MHYCAYHKQEEPKENFRIKGKQLDSWCIEGRREYNREYSRKKYAPIKAQVAKKKIDPPVVKVCTGCKEEKLIDEFPFRYDRPGKRYARCDLCKKKQTRNHNQTSYLMNQTDRINYARRYRKDNQEKHREAVRKRAKRKFRVRREDYLREEIYQRDQGLCFFCKEPIDRSLIYPDPGSMVIHHIIPISKYGPDTPSNVAIAHHSCNGKHYNHSDSPFNESWSVREISNTLAREIAKGRHYLHRPQNSSFAFGLFHNDDIKGMVSFGSPSSQRTAKSVCEDNYLVIELTRLWIDQSAPPNAASWLVSRALKDLPPFIVITYADTAIQDSRNGRHHDGTIYRSLSFNYAGKTKEQTDWCLPGSSRNVGRSTPGSEPRKVSSKQRYWTVTGAKRDKRTLLDQCQWPILPYDES